MSDAEPLQARGALLLATRSGLRFVPSEVASTLTFLDQIVPVPGLLPPAVGVAVAEDRVITALSVGEEPGTQALLCEVEGGWIALVGARIVACVRLEHREQQRIEWEGQQVEPLDLRGLMIEAESALWRARGSREEV